MARHNMELEDNRATLESTLPLTFKFSTELLNLRKMEVNLGKQKNFKDAHQMQTRANALEAKERNAYMKARNDKIMA